MKSYEEAIESLPETRQGKHIKAIVKSELKWLKEEAEPDPLHTLKAARICVNEWTQNKEFAPKVFETLKTINYSKLDFFEKGILYILASCPYKDGFFDLYNANIDYGSFDLNANVKKWIEALNRKRD